MPDIVKRKTITATAKPQKKKIGGDNMVTGTGTANPYTPKKAKVSRSVNTVNTSAPVARPNAVTIRKPLNPSTQWQGATNLATGKDLGRTKLVKAPMSGPTKATRKVK